MVFGEMRRLSFAFIYFGVGRFWFFSSLGVHSMEDGMQVLYIVQLCVSDEGDTDEDP